MIWIIRFTLALASLCSLFPLQAATAATAVHHHLDVTIHPLAGSLDARDVLDLPTEGERVEFELHVGLSPRVTDGDARLESMGRRGYLERYLLLPKAGERQVTLSYAGVIRHGMQEVAESPGLSHQVSRGTISPQGVFLSAASGWYPWISDTLHSFDLSVRLPAGWLAVSQGSGPEIHEQKNTLTVRWQEDRPQDDIYLIASPFELYRKPTPVAEAQVYLRRADPDLAEPYLEATGRYLDLYQKLLGNYPYDKFALVESFWDTGYGMPSFTLLGPRVIRLPFIIHTSYPHEILHNWWGNGVYVDYASGNWSEGLTTYLADHLLKEQRGQGAAYRRDALQRYADYVRTGQDFPLAEFRGRHSSASQSVGYGKGFMLFHMLRRELGDRAFIAGLRRFYAEQRFNSADYADLQQAFEQVTELDLSGFFNQWLSRTGAPTLAVSEIKTEKTGNGFRISGKLVQTQASDPFQVRVPIVLFRDQDAPLEYGIPVSDRETRFELNSASRPLRLEVDPRFDLFRGLYPEESPPTLSALFGSQRGMIVLPANTDSAMAEQYRSLAENWTRGYDGWEIQKDDELDVLPGDRPVWVLGWDNRFRGQVAGLLPGVELNADGALLESGSFARQAHSIVLATGDTAPLAWLGAHSPQAVPGLTRKLPHYGKYGYLVFTGAAPKNIRKGQWTVRASPLSVLLVKNAPPQHLAPAPALTDALDQGRETQ